MKKKTQTNKHKKPLQKQSEIKDFFLLIACGVQQCDCS